MQFVLCGRSVCVDNELAMSSSVSLYFVRKTLHFAESLHCGVLVVCEKEGSGQALG